MDETSRTLSHLRPTGSTLVGPVSLCRARFDGQEKVLRVA